MGTARDLGLLMLRLGVGASCFTRGAKELFGGGGVEETVGTSTAWGSEPGDRSVRLSAVLESGGGALLALGLATGTAGAALTGNMIVASSVQTSNRFLTTNEGFELPVAYALVGTLLTLTGPGRFSVDHVIGGALNRPWMRALSLIGALASAAYLVVTRSAVLAERDDIETDARH